MSGAAAKSLVRHNRSVQFAGPSVGLALLFLRNQTQAERAADTGRFFV